MFEKDEKWYNYNSNALYFNLKSHVDCTGFKEILHWIEAMKIECPYCPAEIEIDTQKHLKCPRCGSEIILNQYNRIESAKRFDGVRKSTYIIWLAILIVGALAILFEKGAIRRNLPTAFLLIVGCIFLDYSIQGFKYKELFVGGIYISKDSNPDSFSFILGLAVFVSVVSFSLCIIDIAHRYLF
jgi:DNA-directed RNA polymerase subunit RPC12/RpoP